MKYLVVAFIVLIVLILIWFFIPWSPLKKSYDNEVKKLVEAAPAPESSFTVEDFSHLPELLQNYFIHSGYIGQPKHALMTLQFKNVRFQTGVDSPSLKIDYEQMNVAKPIARLALIDSRMFGVPFQGFDYYLGEKGGMHGMIAKLFTLFHPQHDDIRSAALVTYLAEIIFLPEAILQNDISFEPIDEYTLKATLKDKDLTVGGTFTFNEDYQMIAFKTEDRAMSEKDDQSTFYPWSALCSDYFVNDQGISQPRHFQAVWHLPEKDLIYFDGDLEPIQYTNASD